MKSEEEISRALRLLYLLLSGQVKLKHPLPPEALLNTQGVVRALEWTVGFPNPLQLETLLRQIEEVEKGPGFNPHQSLTE